MNKNKIFDLHIGLSDAMVIMKNDPFTKSECVGEFPNQFDLQRSKSGGLKSFISFMCPIEFKDNDFNLPADILLEIQKHVTALNKVKEKIEKDNLDLKIFLGLEGIHFVNKKSDLENLKILLRQNIQFVGVKWEFESSLFQKDKLTKLGIETLKIIEERNVVIDLSHCEEGLWREILKNFKGKVINSHTNCFNINPHKRNSSDELIKEIISRGGVIGLTFMADLVGGSEIKSLVKHFEYFKEKFGSNNLCIGSDFDGMDIACLIKNLEDVSKYPNFIDVLRESGFNSLEIENICFNNADNFLRKIDCVNQN